MTHLIPATSRRRFLETAAGAAVVLGVGAPVFGQPAAATASVGALFAGKVDDRGFMEAGWRGLERARVELGATTSYIDNVLPQKELLVAALTRLADSGVELVVAHGGQNNEAANEVAWQFPRLKFVVTQGDVTAANLSSYDVLQEESAYLAGVLAAKFTRTGVVGHMSGIRVRPGLKGRAAYAAGLRATDPRVRLLTNFSGNQDDNTLSRRVALAQIGAGADVVFTMLNAGRNGVTEACRDKGTRQIGNVIDWVALDPKVFVGSAIADVGTGVFNAVRDLRDGRFQPGVVRKLGLADSAAVRLSVAQDVPIDLKAMIADVADGIRSGRIHVPDQYDGPEFQTPG